MTTPLSNDQTLPVIVWVRSPGQTRIENQRQPRVTHLRNSGPKRRRLTAYLFLDWSPTSPSKLRRSPRSFPDISGCSGRGGNQATREGSLQASNEVASRRPHGRQAIFIHIDVLSLCNLICHFQLFNHCHWELHYWCKEPFRMALVDLKLFVEDGAKILGCQFSKETQFIRNLPRR